MFVLFRLLVNLALLLAFFTILFCCPQIGAPLGLNLTDWQELLTAEEKIAQRKRDLYKVQVWLNRRVAGKEQLCRDLIAGRLSLPQSLSRWRELHPPADFFWEMLHAYGVGRTEEERLAHEIMDRVRLMLESDGRSDEIALLRMRFENELQTHLDQIRSFRLPK